MKSFVFLANGFEEIEALATVDVLRRAGMVVTTVSINPTKQAVGAHGVVVEADALLSDVCDSEADWLVMPGGLPGAQYLAECEVLGKMIVAQNQVGKGVAAICAAPAMVLGSLGIMNGRKATGYPGTEQLAPAVDWQSDKVVVDANVITGKGPGAAVDFALAIVASANGQDVADEVAAAMLI